jgi:hypothetical protein
LQERPHRQRQIWRRKRRRRRWSRCYHCVDEGDSDKKKAGTGDNLHLMMVMRKTMRGRRREDDLKKSRSCSSRRRRK